MGGEGEQGYGREADRGCGKRRVGREGGKEMDE